jgi:hypothetical protein
MREKASTDDAARALRYLEDMAFSGSTHPGHLSGVRAAVQALRRQLGLAEPTATTTGERS